MDTGEGEQTNSWAPRNAPTAFQLGARLARRPKRAMVLQVAMVPVRFEKSRSAAYLTGAAPGMNSGPALVHVVAKHPDG